jgi:hypothetical protein
LLTFHWLVSTAALLVAGVALTRARRVSKRLERLTESYWELRYEHGQLRSRLAKIDAQEQTNGGPEQAPSAPRGPEGTQFVPLSSLKRSGLGD